MLRFLKVARFLEQKGQPFELIVIANEPTAIELGEIDRLEATLERCLVIQVPRETLYASWNRGIKTARGDAVCFWNVDDLRFGRAILSGLQDIGAGADVVYFSFIALLPHRYYESIQIPKPQLVLSEAYSQRRSEEGMICGPFFMVRTKFFQDAGLFDEQFKVCGDYDWCVRAGRQGGNFLRNSSIAGLYIKNGKTLSGRKGDITHKVENEVVYRRYQLVSKLQDLTADEAEALRNYRIQDS